MLRISKLADYGTVVMGYLASQYPNLSNARRIAQGIHLSVPTVSKLLKRLAAAGLLQSVRGASGGYRLHRAAATISIAEILYALDDNQGLIECSLESNSCSIQPFCPVQGNWRLISQAIDAALQSVSLEMLAQSSLSTKNVEHIKQLASSGVLKS